MRYSEIKTTVASKSLRLSALVEWRVRMERVSEAVADGDDDEATRWRLAAEEIAAKIAAGLDPDAKAVWHVDQPDVVLQ